MGITSRLAGFVVDTSFSDIPGDVIEKSKDMMLNVASAGLAASGQREVDIITQYVEDMGGKPVSTIMGRGVRSSPLYAALANGFMMDLPDYDGAVRRRNNSAARKIGPAVMAVGECMALSGKEVLLAFTLGCEVSTKLGAAGDLDDPIQPRMARYGWNVGTVAGVVGAAAAVGKLLGLGQEPMESALGIAVSQASGLNRNIGTAVTSFEGGQAAMKGIMAAMLAQRGLAGAQNDIEADEGFFGCYRRDTRETMVDEDEFFHTLANPYDVIFPGMLLKFYPCSSDNGTPVEATLRVVKEHQITPEQVQSVHVAVIQPHTVMYTRPETGQQAQKSVQYCAAVALVHGPPQLHHFTDKAVQDPDPRVRAVMSKVTWEATEQSTLEVPNPSTVTITLTNGEQVSYRAKYEKGHPGNPLTPQELDTKFAACARDKLSPDQIKGAIDQFHHLDELPNVAPLVSIMGGEPGRTQ